ncbi:zinc-finger of the MIZ type in Nse subunit-domain-containing protein [Aspergillus avenaceus]|uniref:Zinc-finger of the MIZ type in Nse subunit-domain-containing protein n=1 Tax=Aspergillus avenaceus TaxID=36643 RepID=A0A5N6TU80_ASPAV|nr:zinc-finger of the MIZ type in Nse subunit-domain-containing protein [Aspergillus avenaceus]
MSRTETTPPLPPYEPPIAPLHASARNALLTFLKSRPLRQLQTHLQHAEEKLTDSAGEVNERVTDAKARFERRGRVDNGSVGDNGAVNGDGDGNGDDGDGDVKRFEETVKDVTGRLDEGIRGVIDAGVRVDSLVGVLGGLEGDIELSHSLPSSSRRRRRRRCDDDDDDEEEDEDDEDAESQTQPQTETGQPPSQKLNSLLDEKSTHYDNLSLTQRYSTNNAYIGFYRIIHDAKHPNDAIPPLPHASTWFSHLEDPQDSTAQSNRRSPSTDSDDITIKRERISLKCPLTLLFYRDPVTSTKCPHSFEREAIENMLAQSSSTVPAPGATGRGARRVRSVMCPVCSVSLTASDLRPDPVLLRRVRRFEAVALREREDEELGGPRKKRKSGIMLPSDDGHGTGEDAEEEDDDDDDSVRSQAQMVRVKQEMSTAPVDDD